MRRVVVLKSAVAAEGGKCGVQERRVDDADYWHLLKEEGYGNAECCWKEISGRQELEYLQTRTYERGGYS